MTDKIRWGLLSTAWINEVIIDAIRKADRSEPWEYLCAAERGPSGRDLDRLFGGLSRCYATGPSKVHWGGGHLVTASRSACDQHSGKSGPSCGSEQRTCGAGQGSWPVHRGQGRHIKGQIRHHSGQGGGWGRQACSNPPLYLIAEKAVRSQIGPEGRHQTESERRE